MNSSVIYSLDEWYQIKNYILNDEKVTKELSNNMNNFDIKEVKFNRPATDVTSYAYTVSDICNTYSMVKEFSNNMNNSKFAIKEVKFNGPATVVFWEDGTKTVVKCGPHDKIDYEKGLAMAITKRALGDKGHYYETIKKYAGEEMAKAENQIHDDIWMAYQTLVNAIEDKKATKANLLWAMEEAIGYLGSRLDK